jgi:hypothetical protein
MGAERRSRAVRGCCSSGQPAQGREKSRGRAESIWQAVQISKQEVWDAWLKVKGNQGAPGVDGQSIEAFEKDLKNNLYKVWLCQVADYAEWAVLGAATPSCETASAQDPRIPASLSLPEERDCCTSASTRCSESSWKRSGSQPSRELAVPGSTTCAIRWTAGLCALPACFCLWGLRR